MAATRVMRCILPAFLLALVFAAAPARMRAQIAISVTMAPPELPVYEQPPCPEEGWMWAPGYWAYDDDEGYYWVPGEWVPAPYVGALWTPPWWGWEGGRYRFHEGYWGDDVGYYGGIDYGYGYMGEGFVGGEWRDGRFAYNTAVMRVNTTVVRNVYVDRTIVQERTIPNERRIAYNGGPGGIRHDPTPIERRGMSGRHTALTPVQQQQIQAARADRSSYARANGGRPQRVVVARPESGGRIGGAPIAPAPSRGEVRPEPSRTSPAYRNEPYREQQNRRPESRPVPTERRPYTESRPAPTERNPYREPAPRPESRPAPEPRQESRPSQEPRYEPRPAPQQERPRTESRPQPPAERPRPESRPEPQPRMESRPAPPARESRPAPPPRESHPAEPHAGVNRPAPQREAARAESRPAAAHPEAHGGGPKQEKPRSE
ncbi:YXWGXW repeat-containing protein [Occallatibacter savannae]|uniref:YXWGXW repeat-containing protein n=1 Tax=Occallatibacter savannae TaxID=1002691 RepID=UPI00194E175D|nr:YXWGXW repeat-containing protein [Occallatibacter savannae]